MHVFGHCAFQKKLNLTQTTKGRAQRQKRWQSPMWLDHETTNFSFHKRTRPRNQTNGTQEARRPYSYSSLSTRIDRSATHMVAVMSHTGADGFSLMAKTTTSTTPDQPAASPFSLASQHGVAIEFSHWLSLSLPTPMTPAPRHTPCTTTPFMELSTIWLVG